MLIERVVPILAKKNYRISIISNDVISQEDADRMRQNLATDQGLLPEKFGDRSCYWWVSSYSCT